VKISLGEGDLDGQFTKAPVDVAPENCSPRIGAAGFDTGRLMALPPAS
jgi:hypothetical protein